MKSQEILSLNTFSEAVERLYEPVSMDEFPTHLFRVIERYVKDVRVTFDELSMRTGAVRHRRNFAVKNDAEWMAQLPIVLEREHPVVAYKRKGGRENLFQLSDFMTQRELRRTAMYNDMLRPIGGGYQIAVLVPIPGYTAGLTLNRDTDFSLEEREFIRLLSSHIIRAHKNARLFSALQGKKPATPVVPVSEGNSALTAREREVLHWLSQGKRDREIATILNTSHRTVHKHVQRILAKLGAETRSAAAVAGANS